MSIILGLLIIIGTIALKSFTVMMMWGWFIVPYTSFQHLTLAASCGIILFHSLLTKNFGEMSEKIDADEWSDRFGVSIATTSVILFLGYLLSLVK